MSNDGSRVKKTAGNQKRKPRGKPFVKGGAPGPGRPKGALNKFTEELKAAILDGIHNAHPEGLQAWVTVLATDNPASAAALLGRLIPLSMDAKVDMNVKATIVFIDTRG